MKVYLEPEAWLSRSIHRVAKALADYRPEGVVIVDKRRRADLEVLHLVGRGGVPDDVGVRPYAVIAYCVRTTETPSTKQWLPLWGAARVTWSYYDLRALAYEDGAELNGLPFYRAPLGVDASVFTPQNVARDFTIGTSGFVARNESIDEVIEAVRVMGGKHFHLGPDVNVPGAHAYAHDIEDTAVARWWSRCRYVSGLRREEGFELPVYEGLLCGARPIVFNAPHYQDWLEDSAVYVPEVEPDLLTAELVDVLRQEPRPVSESERARFVEMLDWKRIAQGFWERALG